MVSSGNVVISGVSCGSTVLVSVVSSGVDEVVVVSIVDVVASSNIQTLVIYIIQGCHLN